MRKSVSATIWSALDRVWSQIVGFVIGVILARLLTPTDYGVVGICMVFITFSNVFIEAGFSNALIRKLDCTVRDYSTAFHFNAVMGLVMYVALFVSSPFIADYFDDQKLISLTRVVSLMIIFNSLCIVPNAILTAELKMRKQAIINITSQLSSGFVAIIFAYKGYGIYALAIQAVLSSFLRTLLFWIVAKWWPTMEFSMDSLKYLWGFGSKLICANMLGVFFEEIYSVLIGKFVGKKELGLYSKGNSLSSHTNYVCNGVIEKVAVPLLSKVQGDKSVLKSKYKELTQLITCVMTFVSGLLIVIGKPLILLLFGVVWIDCVPVFQLLLVANILYYVSTLTLVLLQVINHTEYTLKLEFFKKPVYLIMIFVLLQYGLFGLVIAQVASSFVAAVVNMSAPRKYISYSYSEQLGDVKNYILAIVTAGLLTWGCDYLIGFSNYILQILIRTVIMVSVYICVLQLFRDSTYLRLRSQVVTRVSGIL